MTKTIHTVIIQIDPPRGDFPGRTAEGRYTHQRVAFRPIRTVDRVEPYPTVTDVDLQPIATVLQLVAPAWPRRRLLGDNRLTPIKAAGAFNGLPRPKLRSTMPVILGRRPK